MVDDASNKIRVALLALITTIVMILMATNGIGKFKEPALALSSSVNLLPSSSSSSIHITKDVTLEYSIANSTVLIGAFDSSYSITGDAKSLRSSKNLIISTVEDDFIKSPSVGYVLVANNTSATTSSNFTAATGQKNIANPFASTDTI